MTYFSAVLTLALLVSSPQPQYRIDLTRYFASPQAEAASRARLIAHADAFERTAPSFDSPHAFIAWLTSFDTLLTDVRKHDLYVYLRSERNVNDTADASADDQLGSIEDRIGEHVDAVIDRVGPWRIRRMARSSSALGAYRYFLETSLGRSSHHLTSTQARTLSLAADPAVDAATESYRLLRRSVLASAKPVGATISSAAAAYRARWTPFETHEDAFAALLIPITSVRNGVARLRGFSGAPQSAYFDESLTSASVDRALRAVRASGALARYQRVVARAAARNLHVAPDSIGIWALASADTFKPTSFSFAQAIPLVLAAEQPMGKVYASAYARLLDPANRRVDLCVDPACDDAGFSVGGFSGFESGLFFGGYRGTLDNVRAIAHEAGHAVHREFMNENQPLAVYHSGPRFMFESFAIFNELLFYDHLYKVAPTDPQRAYYLNRFLDDATFQIFGSAAETDLEAHIYSLAGSGQLRGAADLDALTRTIFAKYDPLQAADPDARVYWARDSLYYTDPLYDVSYLYAGMLALRYFDDYERDAPGFAKRYVALLKNGFTASPVALERRFLGIDLTNEAALVRNAGALVDRRTAILAKLYGVATK